MKDNKQYLRLALKFCIDFCRFSLSIVHGKLFTYILEQMLQTAKYLYIFVPNKDYSDVYIITVTEKKYILQLTVVRVIMYNVIVIPK